MFCTAVLYTTFTTVWTATMGATFRAAPVSRRRDVAPSSRIWFARKDGYFSSSIMWAAIAPHIRLPSLGSSALFFFAIVGLLPVCERHDAASGEIVPSSRDV